jgi:hypothetical protein
MLSDRLITRTKWSANDPVRVVDAPLDKGQQIHWTAVPGAAEGPHWPDCYNDVQGIQRYHQNTRGWYDIAYNFLVCVHGFVFEGRGFGVQPSAAGTREGNWGYLAIAAIAGPDDLITNNYIRAIQDIVAEHDGADVQKPHSFFKDTSCPGPELTRLTEVAAFKRNLADLPIPIPDPVQKDQVLGLAQVTQEQAIDYVISAAVNAGSPMTTGDLQTMVEAYYEWGPTYGVRPDIAIGMSKKETGNWTWSGDVPFGSNNFAGIGATGGVPGNSFDSIEAGVKAHLLRMRMYASADGSFYDESVLVRPLPSSHWGAYPAIQDFDGVWAVPGVGYGDSVMTIVASMKAWTVTVPVPAPTPQTLEERVQALEERLDAAGL